MKLQNATTEAIIIQNHCFKITFRYDKALILERDHRKGRSSFDREIDIF